MVNKKTKTKVKTKIKNKVKLKAKVSKKAAKIRTCKSKSKSKSKIKPKLTIRTKTKGKPIGKISHYFSKIKVAIIKLKKGLKTGDTIRVIGGNDTDFEQKVKSIEVDHKKIKKAKPKDEIGLKLGKKAREGYKVYKV